jgi:nucleotide-binding universal stress UspA family protein
MTNFRHILVPVDFEPPSRRALDAAIDLALKFDARLTVLHAWDLPTYAYTNSLYLSTDIWTTLERAAREQLESEVAEVQKRFPRAERLLVRGPASTEILAAAERVKADLVIVGTHGRRGLNRMVLGSVAESVVRGAKVPVLVMHEGGKP